ncbi:MAG: hypothetical protein WBB34_08200 [Xanthobacteraceae bacterium]
MRLPVSYAALGSAVGSVLALALAGGSAAQAQTVITPAVVDQPVVTVPAATVVQTTETVRTVRPVAARTIRRHEVITTRTITRRVLPTTTVIARTVPAMPQPLYDEVAPAPVATAPQPLYDEVSAPMAPAPLAAGPLTDAAPVAGDVVATEPYTYRYVYQPDRILVIDPATGTAVQAIPR